MYDHSASMYPTGCEKTLKNMVVSESDTRARGLYVMESVHRSHKAMEVAVVDIGGAITLP